MKKIKLIIWISVLYIIQTIFYPVLSKSGFVPDLLLGFTVAYSVTEERFKKLSPIIIITAILSATGTGRVFPIAILSVGLSGIMAYLACGYFRFIPKIVRVIAVTAVFAFLGSIAEYFATAVTMTYLFITQTAVWHTAYTTAMAVVIYLIMKKTTGDSHTKMLIEKERN